MRVATRTIYYNLQKKLLSLEEKQQKINEQIASGKILNRPSDNPLAVINVLHLRTAWSQVQQYQRNMETTRTWLNLTESALQQTEELIGRAKEIATQMASDTQSATTRALAAKEIDHLLDQAISLANSDLGGKYIFAGYKVNTLPFTRVGEDVQYNGDTNSMQIAIGQEETLSLNKDGQTAFMDSNIFTILGTLKSALENNQTEEIRQQLENLESVAEHFNNQIVDVGARLNRLEAKQSILKDLDFFFQERISEEEEAEISALVVELKAKELAYQAALLSSAKIHELTLLNYLH
ncbi:MAG: flagellar hook-associated protein FlgL [Thermodesulfobacteriota bacterium]